MKLPKPSETVFYKIEKAIKYYRVMSQGNLNKLGYKITINQIILLIEIDRNPEISQVDLAELLFKDVASITRMIELLVREGFIKREEHKEDRRKKNLNITKKGKKLLDKAIPIIATNRELAQKNISEKDIDTLIDVLNEIIQNTSK